MLLSGNRYTLRTVTLTESRRKTATSMHPPTIICQKASSRSNLSYGFSFFFLAESQNLKGSKGLLEII